MECPKCWNTINSRSNRCGRCGAIIPPGQYLLEQSGVVERPTASSAPARRLQQSMPRCAGLGDRLIAAVLDSIVILGAVSIISVWSFKRWSISIGNEFHLTSASVLIAATLSAIVLFIYSWILEGCFGATLGKFIVGIRVVRTTERGDLAASAIRNALRIVDGIGLYMLGAIVAGCSQFRQRLGDMLADTIVIEERFSGGTRLMAVVLWLGTLIGAGWGLPRVGSAEFSSQAPPYFSQTLVRLGYAADSAYVCMPGLRIDVHRDPVTQDKGIGAANPSSGRDSLE